MPRIQILAESVFRKIAAGEVIERPLSVVKELVENAIDADAGAIAVAMLSGGKEMIRVEDDGCGFGEADIEIAFQRHSTSKLVDLEDLDRLLTLGFRGEALPSILEVADIDLITADNNDGRGWHCRFRGGRLQEKNQASCRRGSTVTVQQLFTNFPVRRKFMKSDQGEMRPVTAFLENAALARPAIAFSLQHNGRTVFSYPAAANLSERIYQVFGKEFLSELRPVDFGDGVFALNGFVSAEQTGASGKGHQFFMVNGRPVKGKNPAGGFQQHLPAVPGKITQPGRCAPFHRSSQPDRRQYPSHEAGDPLPGQPARLPFPAAGHRCRPGTAAAFAGGIVPRIPPGFGFCRPSAPK